MDFGGQVAAARSAPGLLPVLAVAVAVFSGAGAALLAVTGDERWVAVSMLAIVLAALLSSPWFLSVAALAVISWIVAASVVARPGALAAMSLAVLAAGGVAGVIHRLRRRDAEALLEARRQVADGVVRDGLTGALNRQGLALLGVQLVEAARRQGDAVSCLFVDIDGLSSVNSALGERAGDRVLVAVAEALRACVRATDVVARWDGDEFCVVGPGPGMPPREIERRVREHLLEMPPVDRVAWDPSVSAGSAMLTPWDTGSLDTLLKAADRELELRRALRAEVLVRRRPLSAEGGRPGTDSHPS
jgi:diguanylate cyclase (GGDEF)-like protein